MDHSPLGKLSAELRNKIYAYVLPSDKPIPVIETSDGIQAPLTRVCKQLREECLLFFYASNTFTIDLGLSDSSRKADHNAFLERVGAISTWIENTPKTCLAAVHTLTVTCVVKHGCHQAQILGEQLQNVAALLEQAGYDEKRLQLQLRLQKRYIWTDSELVALLSSTGFKNGCYIPLAQKYRGGRRRRTLREEH
ncbi:hypothetical protein PRZ48_007612 [Zasmidium cellare]|uniref:Uncharacterized protein n=1 Tax=Zasmidium cellare TaxID=395010 RepID=A0ABR0ELY2_ZASCE|nr:hypothetical protein PRZ48_007612 [Zasmidium cellare]